MKKMIFMDIDGTLVDFQGCLCDSAKEALIKAKENRHKLFLCSGRIYKEFYPFLADYDFDGFVAAAGAHISYKGVELYHHVLQKEKVAYMLKLFEEYKLAFMLQATSGSYSSEEGFKKLVEFYSTSGRRKEEWIASLKAKVSIVDDMEGLTDVEKMLYIGAPLTLDEMRAQTDPYFTITTASYGKANVYNGEITRRGIDKASGIQHIIHYLGRTKEDCIAIGDGANDLPMMQFAEIGVAMGNASNEVKKAADLITKDINDNGLYQAFKTLNII